MPRPATKRKDDNPENYEAWRREVREGRARTILYAILASGLVTLFLANAIEAQNYNERVEDARINCQGLVDGFDALADVAKDVAANSESTDVKARWTGYEVTFRTIVPPKAPTCNEQFPRRSYVPFID